MKVVLVLAVVAAAALARPDDVYDDSKMNLDVDELVANNRLLKGYATCFLNKGPCTPEGNNIKKFIPEAVENSCKKCTPKGRVLVRKMANGIKAKLQEEWKELEALYDPEGKHSSKIDAFLAETD